MKRYKALLLDADDTLLDFQENERESVRNVFAQFGLSADDSVLTRYSEINKALWLSYERGEIAKQTIWEERFPRLFQALGIDRDGLRAERLYRAALGRGSQTVPGAAELCRELDGEYALYIITNGAAETQYSRIRNAGLEQWMRGIFISEKVGAPKPDPRYFDAVFAQIPFSRPECLVVGDSLTSDVQGGINAGVDTCWYNPGFKTAGSFKPTYEIHTLNELKDVLNNTGE